jgi:predicted signal transduction protein with EAL and GGDEF domain
VILVAGAGPESARLVAERHRAAIERLDPGSTGPKQVTLSVGLAVFEPDRSHESPEELLRRADTALYDAKRAGRNRVVMGRRSSAPPESRSTTPRPARLADPGGEPSYPAPALSTGRAQQ